MTSTPPPMADAGQIISATVADADFVFHEWHRRAIAADVDGLLELYLPDATFESPLVPRLLDQSSGTLRGHDQIHRFLERGTAARPAGPVRFWRTGRYLFDGHTLIWEYPRTAPDGDQLDLAEVMDLDGPRIASHRVHWGWAGSPLLARFS